MAAKEKVEAKAAVNAVAEADAKVEAIKAEKIAKKAQKQEARLANWKWKGAAKAVNYVENNAKPIGIGMAIGGPLGVGIAYGIKKGVELYQSKKAGAETDAADVDDSGDEGDTTAFD